MLESPKVDSYEVMVTDRVMPLEQIEALAKETSGFLYLDAVGVSDITISDNYCVTLYFNKASCAIKFMQQYKAIVSNAS